MAGNGDLLEEYKSRLDGVTNVTFYGNLDNSELSELLSKMDIAYFSSVNSKAYDYGWSPNKLLLYMRFGLPVIAGYTGYKSMLNEARCGNFIDPSNVDDIREAILTFSNLSNDALYSYGERGSKWLRENRLWKKLSQDLFRILFV